MIPKFKELWWHSIWERIEYIQYTTVATQQMDYQLNESDFMYVPGEWFTAYLNSCVSGYYERHYDWAIIAIQSMGYEELKEFHNAMVIPF